MIEALHASPKPSSLGMSGRVWLRALASLMALLVVVAAAAFLWFIRESELDAARKLTKFGVGNLVVHLQSSLRQAELALARLDARLADLPAGQQPGPVIREALAAINPLLSRLPLPAAIQALGADGQDLDGPPTGQALPRWPDAPGWVALPAQGHEGQRIVPMLRRSSATRQGVAAWQLGFDLDAMLRHLKARHAQDGGGATLLRIEADGGVVLLARYPHIPQLIGKYVRGPLSEALLQAPAGSLLAEVKFDQVERLFAYQRLDGEASTMVAVNGIGLPAALAHWWEILPWTLAATLMVLAGIAIGAYRRDQAWLARARQFEALRLSEQRFRLAAASGQVWEWDFGSSALVAPTEFFQSLGLGPVPPDRVREVFEGALHPEDLVEMTRMIVRHFKGLAPYQLQFRATDAAGRTRWFDTKGQALHDAQGRAVYMAGTTFEITERREAEQQVQRLAAELEQRVIERTEQLARSEARYRNIFETVPVAIAELEWSGVQQLLRALRAQGVTDLTAHLAAQPGFARQCLQAVSLRRLNRKAKTMHAELGQPHGSDAWALVLQGPDGLPRFVGQVEAMWQGQRQYSAKFSPQWSDGPPLSLMLTASLPALDDDDATGLLCLLDISELDRLNAELDRSMARLRQVNQELETFTYSVSHDLKAPLRGIDGYSRLLLTDHADRQDDEGREFLGHIRRATQHMGALIDDLLAYSRLERRDLVLTRQPLATLVQQVLNGLQPALDGANVELTVQVAPGLAVLADSQGLVMALRNLVDNALKFSRASVPPRIGIEATAVNGKVRLAVHDNGVGFEMKFHDRIFSIFQRLHRAEQFPGTGIGLAIVHKAMDRMGGKVWASSQPGKGATFTLELPEALTT